MEGPSAGLQPSSPSKPSQVGPILRTSGRPLPTPGSERADGTGAGRPGRPARRSPGAPPRNQRPGQSKTGYHSGAPSQLQNRAEVGRAPPSGRRTTLIRSPALPAPTTSQTARPGGTTEGPGSASLRDPDASGPAPPGSARPTPGRDSGVETDASRALTSAAAFVPEPNFVCETRRGGSAPWGRTSDRSNHAGGQGTIIAPVRAGPRPGPSLPEFGGPSVSARPV